MQDLCITILVHECVSHDEFESYLNGQIPNISSWSTIETVAVQWPHFIQQNVRIDFLSLSHCVSLPGCLIKYLRYAMRYFGRLLYFHCFLPKLCDLWPKFSAQHKISVDVGQNASLKCLFQEIRSWFGGNSLNFSHAWNCLPSCRIIIYTSKCRMKYEKFEYLFGILFTVNLDHIQCKKSLQMHIELSNHFIEMWASICS